MRRYLCKFCGGILIVKDNEFLGTCAFCGLSQDISNNTLSIDSKNVSDFEQYLDVAQKYLALCFFSEAEYAYELALKENAKSSISYLGMFLAKNNCKNLEEALNKCPDAICTSSDYAMAINYSIEPEKTKLIEIKNQCMTESKEKIYLECLKLESKLVSFKPECDDIYPLIQKYILVGDYKDSNVRVCIWIASYIVKAEKYAHFNNGLIFLEYISNFYSFPDCKNDDENLNFYEKLQMLVLINLGYSFNPNNLLTTYKFGKEFEKFENSIEKYTENQEKLVIFKDVIVKNISQGLSNISVFIEKYLPIIGNELDKYTWEQNELAQTIDNVNKICAFFNKSELSKRFSENANQYLTKTRNKTIIRNEIEKKKNTVKTVLWCVLIIAILLISIIIGLISALN